MGESNLYQAQDDLATDVDIAIVGGGISGIYSGWRLMTANVNDHPELKALARERTDGKLRVAVYEMSDRIGGRLLTVAPPGVDTIACELGGMRFLSSQILIRSLVERVLGLETYPFPVDSPNNIAYLRGRHLRHHQLTVSNPLRNEQLPEMVPYELGWIERSLSAANLVSYAIEQLIPGVRRIPTEQLRGYLQQIEIEGRPLHQWGFWNLIARAISKEAYDLSFAVSGYDTVRVNVNALDAIYENYRDFGTDLHYIGLVDGFANVPNGIANLFTQAGGEIQLGHQLLGIDVDGSQLHLTFQMQHSEQGANPSHIRSVRAKKVILAMPRRSLESLDGSGPVLGNPTFQQLIRTTTPVPAFKIYIAYDHPWWEDAVGVSHGRSITDLPIRQCYYWRTDPNTGIGVIMASYDDATTSGFWRALEDPPHAPHAHPTRFAQLARLTQQSMDSIQSPKPEAQRLWLQHEAPNLMVSEVQRQLAEMHNQRYLPEPLSAAYMDWSQDPYGGYYHAWNLHEKSWELIPRILQPIPDFPVYICGEAYSGEQGWVEGALGTAEMILQNKMGISPPNWLLSEG